MVKSRFRMGEGGEVMGRDETHRKKWVVGSQVFTVL